MKIIKQNIKKKSIVAAGFLLVSFVILGVLRQFIEFDAYYDKWLYLSMALMVAGIMLHIESKGRVKVVWNIVLLLGAAILSYVIFQVFQSADFTGTGKTLVQDILNVACCVGIYLIVYIICGRMRLTLLITGSLLYIFGWVLFAVNQFRGEILLFPDLMAIQTAFQVASSYQLKITGNAVVATFLFIALCLWAVKADWQIGERKTQRRLRISAALVCVAFYGYFFIGNVEQYAYTFDLKKNGYPYSFMLSVKMSHITPPEGYTPENIPQYMLNDQIVASRTFEESSPFTVQESDDIKPNIIAIMNESFSDLSVLGEFETNIDYMPFIQSLEENTIKGNLHVSVFGGGTCDSEYAFLTGNTTAFLPENARPYQQYIHEETPGLVRTLEAQGYSSLAVHSGWGTAWNRNVIYPLLGFDDFIAEENEAFAGAERTRNYFISDRANYQVIEEAFENKEAGVPFFSFNVTISNHSAYDKDGSDLEPVWIEGHQGEFSQTEQYLSLMRRSDSDFKELVEYFSAVEEPTIIVMFGDHQGYVDDSFYEFLRGKPIDEWSMEELQLRNTTPFVIWANYDIEEATIDALGINNLGSLVLKTAGLEMTAYDKYLLELSETIPVITTIGLMDTQGNCYSIDAPGPYADVIHEYEQILYNNIFDVENRQNQLFYLQK